MKILTQALTTLKKAQAQCKQCGKEPRQPGSSRGKRCSDLYRMDEDRKQITALQLTKK